MKKILLFVFIIYSIVNNQLLAAEQPKTLSRYESAIELAEKLAELENNSCAFSRTQLIELEKKCVEYSDELAKLGINVSSLEKDLADVKEDIAVLKSDVADLKSNEDEKITFKGKVVFENKNYVFSREEKNDVHKTTMDFNLEGIARIDKDIEIYTKWSLLSGNELTGNNLQTQKVKAAELKFKNIFDSDDLLRVGRSYIRHGSAFIVKDEMDGINYSRYNGDTKMEYAMYFQKQLTEAYHPICNIYFERNKSDKKCYFDLYYNSYEDGYYNVAYTKNAAADKRNVKNCDIWLFNTGILGQFGGNKEFEYLFDGTVSRLHDDNQKKKTQIGYAGHASLRCVPKDSDFKGMIVYNFITYDCYEELGTKIRKNSWEDFDDMSFDDKYWDYGYKLVTPNNQDWRFLISYEPKRYPRHRLSVNYDYITAIDPNKPYGHLSEEEAEIYKGTDMKNIMYGIEYSYKVSKTTDFVINYENQKDKTFDGYYDSYNLIFSMISKF